MSLSKTEIKENTKVKAFWRVEASRHESGNKNASTLLKSSLSQSKKTTFLVFSLCFTSRNGKYMANYDLNGIYYSSVLLDQAGYVPNMAATIL